MDSIGKITQTAGSVLKTNFRRRLNQLGDEAAAHFRTVLPNALRSANHVVVLTHVPPFVESSWYAGKHSDSDWLPFFPCKAAGDVLSETMKLHPDKQMTVLCGHTHWVGIPRFFRTLEHSPALHPMADRLSRRCLNGNE